MKFRNALFYSNGGKKRQKTIQNGEDQGIQNKNFARFICCSGKYEVNELNLVLLGQEIKKNMVELKRSANETNNECVQNSEVETSWGDTNSENRRWNKLQLVQVVSKSWHWK